MSSAHLLFGQFHSTFRVRADTNFDVMFIVREHNVLRVERWDETLFDFASITAHPASMKTTEVE